MSSLKRLGTVGKMFVPQQFKPSVDKEDINMAKGENIFKRKDGRWEARYIKGYELSGKIKYGFCYGKTYREAKEKVTKCKAALVSGKPVPSANSRRRFSFYCDEWLRLRKPKVKESTYIKYDTALIKHIKPKLGGCFPMGITAGLIDGFTEELLFEEELAPKTVHDVLVVLHGVLKYTAAFFPGTFPAVEINNQSRVKKRCGYYLVRSRPDSFLTCWRIWIHASSAFCWRSLQASVSESFARCNGENFL